MKDDNLQRLVTRIVTEASYHVNMNNLRGNMYNTQFNFTKLKIVSNNRKKKQHEHNPYRALIMYLLQII